MAVAGGGSLDGAAAPPPAPAVRRFVASIEWVSFGDAFEVAELDVVGLAVTALPVLHGADYTCYGFAFGPPQERVVYLSDYTALLPQTDALLASWSSGGEAIHLLVLDALRAEGSHPAPSPPPVATAHPRHASTARLVRQPPRPRHSLRVGGAREEAPPAADTARRHGTRARAPRDKPEAPPAVARRAARRAACV
mmetsp:Transcript_7364/g.24397  ORF Transcript_7364/g.24397 Transcript_7364/m.24397 type:complete len:195 (+) Transcript_7364:933-1517(+)